MIQVRLTVHYIDENGKALGPDNHLMNSRDHHFRLTAPPLIGYDFQKAILPNGQHVKDPTVAGTMSGETPELTFVYTTADSLDRKSTRLNSSHSGESRMPSSA